MKATGTSIYRVIFPVFVIAAAISTGLFFFDQLYIPGGQSAPGDNPQPDQGQARADLSAP